MSIFKKIMYKIRGEKMDFGFLEEGTDGIGEKGKPNESKITRFTYRYNGSIGGNNYSYDIKFNNGKYNLEIYMMEHNDYGTISMEIDKELINKVYELYKKHKIYQWNGYSKTAKDVCDGDGFTMYIDFENKENFKADGYNAYPNGYRFFKKDLDDLFLPYVDKFKELGRKNKIEKGVEGELKSVYFYIKQYGIFGDDDLKIVIRYDSWQKLFVIETAIKSIAEKYEKYKDKKYYKLPAEAINTEIFNDLVKKYNIIQWTDFYAEPIDSNNREWFQIMLNYEVGDIKAVGSQQPQNYFEFKEEFLEKFFVLLEDLKKNYNLE